MAIDFYRSLSGDTSKSCDETVKAFRQHYNEILVVFRGRLARRVQQLVEKLTNFLGDLQILALKAYLQESNEIGEHLILRRFLEIIEKNQLRLDMGKNLGDADMALDKALERALNIEAGTRIEEEDKEPRVSAIQTNEGRLINLTGKLIISFDRKERGQKYVDAEVSEVQKKPEIEIETKLAITEAALILDESITTVKRNRQHREARTEAEIGRTRVVPSNQRQP